MVTNRSDFAKATAEGYVPIWRESVLRVLKAADIPLKSISATGSDWWLQRAAKVGVMAAMGPRWAVELASGILGIDESRTGFFNSDDSDVAAAILLAVRADVSLRDAVEAVGALSGLDAVKSLLRAHRPDLEALLQPKASEEEEIT